MDEIGNASYDSECDNIERLLVELDHYLYLMNSRSGMPDDINQADVDNLKRVRAALEGVVSISREIQSQTVWY